jgi:hypothetical protein
MESWPPPKYDEMRTVMLRVYEACRKNWIPIGAAPNIEVSLVVNPDDAALLAPRDAAFWAYEAYRRTARAVAAPLFAWRGRARSRRIPGVGGGGATAGPASRGDSAAA